MTDALRLSKRLAQLLPCSRREAELYIQGGWVTVDGVVVEEPQFRVTDERIELAPNAKAEPLEPATFLLHQPPGLDADAALKLIAPATRAADDTGRDRVLRAHFARLAPTLPLQAGAGGLAVFTQDGRVLRKLKDDADRIEQEYVVEIAGTLASGGLEALQDRLVMEGRLLPPLRASWQNETHLRIALKNPQPGQIRHACAHVGLTVVTMRRIRIGRVPMAKLPPGQWRYLGTRERF